MHTYQGNGAGRPGLGARHGHGDRFGGPGQPEEPTPATTPALLADHPTKHGRVRSTAWQYINIITLLYIHHSYIFCDNNYIYCVLKYDEIIISDTTNA